MKIYLGNFKIPDVFNIKKRFNRRDFFVAISLFLISPKLIGSILEVFSLNTSEIFDSFIVYSLMGIAFLITIKRFHDLNNSGWHVLTLFVPVYNIYIIFRLFFVKGTAKENKYGEMRNVKHKLFANIFILFSIGVFIWGLLIYSAIISRRYLYTNLETNFQKGKYETVFRNAELVINASDDSRMTADAYFYQGLVLYHQYRNDLALEKLKMIWKYDPLFNKQTVDIEFNQLLLQSKE
jgi:uncharacterized membrane protein YhaH (DUF805 family)